MTSPSSASDIHSETGRGGVVEVVCPSREVRWSDAERGNDLLIPEELNVPVAAISLEMVSKRRREDMREEEEEEEEL